MNRPRRLGLHAGTACLSLLIMVWWGCAGLMADTPVPDPAVVPSPETSSDPTAEVTVSQTTIVPETAVDREAIRRALESALDALKSKLAAQQTYDSLARTRILRKYLDTMHRHERLAQPFEPSPVGDIESARDAVEQCRYDDALVYLTRAIDDADPLTRNAAILLLGRTFRETLRFRESAETFERDMVPVEGVPADALAAHAGHLAIESWIDAGDPSRALGVLDRLIPLLDDYPLRTELVLTGMALLAAADRHADAVALSSHAQANADILFATAQSYERLNQSPSAAKLYRRIVLDHPGSPHAAEAGRNLDAIRSAMPTAVEGFTIGERVEQAKKLDTAGLREEAAEKLKGLIQSKLPKDLDLECRMLRTKILMDLRRNEAALEEFTAIQKRYPKDRALAAVFLRKGIIYRRLGNDKKFLEALRIVEKNHVGSSYWIEALLTRGEYYRGQGKAEMAAKDFEAVAAKGGSTAVGAQWRRAWIAYDQKQFTRAAEMFGRIAASNRGTEFEPQAEYWQGRALQQAGDSVNGSMLLAGVASRFAWLYAGQCAAARLVGKASEGMDLAMPTPLPTPDPGHNVDIVFDARVLMTAGYYARASLEVESRGSDRAGLRGRAGLLYRAGLTAKARNLLSAEYKDAIAAGTVDRDIAAIVYPLPPEFRGPIEAAAEEFRLDPLFVASVILQESVFDPAALSINLAAGNMQLLPDTFERFARHWTPPMEGPDRFDPVNNIRAGCEYLRHLLDHFGGSTARALAAYNAGEDRVDEWNRQYPGFDEEEWIEHIPFTQTRMYVKRISEHLGCYRMLYRHTTTGSRE